MRTTNSKFPARFDHGEAIAIPSYVTAVSGSLGGLVEACCLQLIDVIKTRLQLDPRAHREYRGIWHCGCIVVEREGVRALWKGLTPFATHLTLKYTLHMGSNALFQSALTCWKPIVTPFEVVKIRLEQQQLEALNYTGPVHCVTTIVGEEGVRGLWAGVAPTGVRNGPTKV